MPIIGPIASKFLFAFTLITGSVGAGGGVGKYRSENYSDIANRYVQTKYQNGYLDFGDNVSEASDHRSLMTIRTHEIRTHLVSNPDSLHFVDSKKGLGENLVLFCRDMKGKILREEDLSTKELKNIGWCNNSQDGSIKPSDAMNKRGYWVDLFVRAKYKDSDFSFWDNPLDNLGERLAKFRDLKEKGYEGDMSAVLGKAKLECNSLISKFSSGDKFTEDDLNENIPRCLPTLKKAR